MGTNDAGQWCRTKTTENNWIFNEVKPSSVQSNELVRLSFAFSFTYVAKLNITVNIEPEIYLLTRILKVKAVPNSDFDRDFSSVGDPSSDYSETNLAQ